MVYDVGYVQCAEDIRNMPGDAKKVTTPAFTYGMIIPNDFLLTKKTLLDVPHFYGYTRILTLRDIRQVLHTKYNVYQNSQVMGKSELYNDVAL